MTAPSSVLSSHLVVPVACVNNYCLFMLGINAVLSVNDSSFILTIFIVFKLSIYQVLSKMSLL